LIDLEGRELSEARVTDSRVGLGLFAIKVTKDIIDVSRACFISLQHPNPKLPSFDDVETSHC